MSEFDDLELAGDADVDEAGAAEANPRSILTADDRAALGDVRFDEPMRRHTTLKIGGPADAFAEPTSTAAARELLRVCAQRKIPVTPVGGGTNLLVRDGGVRGVVLGTRRLRGLSWIDETRMRVEAGVKTSKVLKAALDRSLGGVEFLGGVPGTIGGGMIMNAGTYMGELKDVTTLVRSVRISDGHLVERDNAACGFVYRGSAFGADEIVLEAELALRPRPRAEMQLEIEALRKRRHEREPKKVANSGSTFKNPAGDFAGRIIESCNLKGTQVGDAEVSPAHANWLVNNGRARARDLLQLIEIVRGKVRDATGVDLVLEVKVIGEDP